MKDWKQELDTIINQIRPTHQTLKESGTPKPMRTENIVNFFDKSKIAQFLVETDLSGDTLLHVLSRVWLPLRLAKIKTKNENDITEEIVTAILILLETKDANFFMPNNNGETPYGILSHNLHGQKLLDQLFPQQQTDLKIINELVTIKGLDPKSEVQVYLCSFSPVSLGIAFLYTPLRLAPELPLITPMDLLSRAAAKHPNKYAIIQAFELARKAFKNPSEAQPVPDKIDDTLAIKIIDKTDKSGLAYQCRWPSWGLTQSQNTSIYRIQQQKFAKILKPLEILEGLEFLAQQHQIGEFIKSFFVLLNEKTEDGKIMTYNFGPYTKYILGISMTSQDCLYQAHRAFITFPIGSHSDDNIMLHHFITSKNDQLFLPNQIDALNIIAEYAGWGQRYFDQYQPKQIAQNNPQ